MLRFKFIAALDLLTLSEQAYDRRCCDVSEMIVISEFELIVKRDSRRLFLFRRLAAARIDESAPSGRSIQQPGNR